MVSVDIIEQSAETISVRFQGVPRQYLNALRRLAISEVPTMAIDDVVIHDNSSVMHDEILVHRLGLIPLRTELSRFVKADECECKSSFGCPKCRVLLYLDVEATDKVKPVLSGDLSSEDEYVKPVSPDIPIVVLATGQRVKLEAYARLGTGKMHAKWQPVSVSVLKEGNENGEYILHLESVGSLSPKEILLESLRILSDKLKLFEGEIKRLEHVEPSIK